MNPEEPDVVICDTCGGGGIDLSVEYEEDNDFFSPPPCPVCYGCGCFSLYGDNKIAFKWLALQALKELFDSK